MRTVRVQYHQEGDQWWADSDDVPGWIAGGGGLEEARAQVREGLPFFLDIEIASLDIQEQHGDHPVVVYRTWTDVAQSFFTGTLGAHGAPPVSVKPLRGPSGHLVEVSRES